MAFSAIIRVKCKNKEQFLSTRKHFNWSLIESTLHQKSKQHTASSNLSSGFQEVLSYKPVSLFRACLSSCISRASVIMQSQYLVDLDNTDVALKSQYPVSRLCCFRSDLKVPESVVLPVTDKCKEHLCCVRLKYPEKSFDFFLK